MRTDQARQPVPKSPEPRERLSRWERFVLGLGINALSVAVVVAERLPARPAVPERRRHRGRGT